MYTFKLTADEVVEQYAPIVKKQLKQLNVFKDYEDYYQIGLIALWEAYERFDPQKGTFATFAMNTVRGKLLTQLYKEKTYATRHHITEEDFHQITDQNVATPLERELLAPYLEGLTERQQIWVKEAIMVGKATADIARDYKVSVHTVRSWKKGALKVLKTRLKRESLLN
ncbi:sigma-70 family RNA polymerase sigma factor [Alkalihalobacterium elongatum]|uniref:sigma-70 family RNA polymerase sigma factor n=1 Tax=Alkalihalobacterium elongatum TaxID=2675466 RepID=UPI001C1F415C|nr:sigma-70 family RNA polymerase sigma factor [Alkalihalobacterium elongatum]